MNFSKCWKIFKEKSDTKEKINKSIDKQNII
nr:MAG TPA: hypothetical protein [Caudoviricetes sp.]